MKTSQIAVDVAKTLGTDMRLTGMREAFKYKDGKRTDEQDGYRYEVVLIDRAFEKITFKVGENKPLFTDKEVEANIKVEAINPQITLYPNYKGGETGMNITADSLEASIYE